MKKLKLFALLVVLLSSITSNAQTLVDGIYFQFYDHWVDGKLDATAYVTHDGTWNYNSYSGNVVIPETVTYEGRTYTVNRIESEAFRNCPNLTSVSIPNSVKSMGDNCFYECTNLTSVNIPTDITSIESSCFYNCKKLANITIPNAVKYINGHAFYGCNSLLEINLPDQLTNISQYAFEKCHKLETIDIPSSVTSIGEGAFYDCDGLTDITIPSSVTSLGNRVFSVCQNLSTVTISCNITSLPSSIFSGCSKLTSVTLPSTITSIGEYAFQSCSSLKDITLPNGLKNIGNYAFESCYSLNTTIPTTATSIGEHAFTGGTITLAATDPSWLKISEDSRPFGYADEMGGGLKIVVADNAYDAYIASDNWSKYKTNIFAASEMPRYTHTDDNGVTWNYRYVYSSKSLSVISAEGYTTSLVFPATLPCGEESLPIGEVEFGIYGNKNLISVDLSNTLISKIAMSMGVGKPSIYFYNCPSLKQVVLPSTLKEIGYNAFYDCYNIETTIPTSVTTVADQAFSGGTITLSATDPSWLTIGENSNPFGYGDGMGGIKIVVADNAYDAYKSSEIWRKYHNCIYPASEMPRYTHTDENGVTWNYRYVYSLKLLSIISAEGYTTSLVFPATLPYGDGSLPVGGVEFAISNNDVITTVDLSATSITKVGQYGGAWGGGNPSIHFYECPSLQNVILPSALEEIGYYAFCNCPSLETINWSNLTSLKTIGQYAFASDYEKRYSFITNVDLSATKVETIGDHAFYEMDKLEEINFPSTLKTISSCAFENCRSLRHLNLSQTQVAKLDGYSFRYCYGLQTVVLPATLKEIGSQAFENDHNLREIDLSNVETIGDRAFDGCSSLYNIDLSSTKSIGLNVFTSNLIVTINSSTPAAIKPNSFTKDTKFYVTTDAYDTFCATLIWSNWANNISMYNIDTDGVKWMYRYIDDENAMCIIAGSGYGNSVTIPSNVLYRGANVPVTQIENIFSGSSITSITLPSTLTSIGYNAFSNSALKTINIPESVTSIGNNAFDNCVNLEYVNFDADSKLESLGSNVFANCTSLVTIELPTSIKTAGYYTFSNCRKLENIDLSKTSLVEVSNGMFSSCSALNEITLPATLTTIGDYAFYYSNLLAIEIPASVTTIGDRAFYYCDTLTSVTFEQNSALKTIGSYAFAANEYDYDGNSGSKLTSIEIPSSVTSIGEGAFAYCRKLKAVTLGANSQLISIGNYAFRGCYNISDFDLSKVQTIGNYAFNGANLASIDLSSAISVGANAFSGEEPFFTINNTTPATIESGTFPSKSIFLVPGSAVNTYKTANIWNNYASRILDSNVAIQNLTLTAKTSRSDLEVQIGDANLLSVVDLTIKGSINSYDFMVMRNKMPFLRRLNLSEAHIVGNNYEHYTGYHTDDNKFPGYGLYNCKLVSLELPQSITEIGYNALANISYLKEIVIPEGVTSIGGYAFSNSYNLRTISTPKSLTRIGYGIFQSCYNLEAINIPKGVTEIPSQAFSGCSSLESIVLPPTIESIGSWAFSGCSNLKELRIPSSVRRIEDYAFSGTNIEDVYVHVVEPFNINQQTFAMIDNNFKGTLHAPKVSYWNYFYNTQWSQFLKFAEFDEPYENFYLEGDKILDEETGNIRGEEGNAPDAELGSGSGLKVEDNITQDLGDVEIKHNGENGGSIIVDGTGEVTAENMTFHINVNGGRWYFFCFPFDIRKEDIRMDKGAEWVFRYYDGELRASQGQGGWKDVTSEDNGNFLKAATGYVFQCSKGGVLTLSAKNGKFKKEDKYNELVEHVAKNANDASWNFVGNPYLSYYAFTSSDYSAPITVWDGYNYVAIRPGDDDYQLAPFEAFFVQKPNDVDAVNYDSDNQMTHTEVGATRAASAARARQTINPDRLLVNLTLTSGEKTDRTRVVFNNDANIKYEVECDAAKFASTGMPQLYSLDANAVKYAINERPVAHGNVSLGYTAPTEGTYTLDAPRMDANVVLVDNATGTVHDFANGGYEFTTEAGTFDNRFILKIKGDATGLEEIEGTYADGPIYNIKGQQVKDMKRPGVYIKGNRKVMSR